MRNQQAIRDRAAIDRMLRLMTPLEINLMYRVAFYIESDSESYSSVDEVIRKLEAQYGEPPTT